MRGTHQSQRERDLLLLLSLSLICSSITLSRQSRNPLKLLGSLLVSHTSELISQTHTEMKPDVSLFWTSTQIERCVCVCVLWSELHLWPLSFCTVFGKIQNWKLASFKFMRTGHTTGRWIGILIGIYWIPIKRNSTHNIFWDIKWSSNLVHKS